MRRLVTFSACLLIGAVTLLSCDVFKTDLNQVNPQQPTEETYFQTLDQLETGIAGIYNPMQNLWARSYYFAADLLSHDAFGMGSLISDLIPLNNRVHGAGNGILADHWNGFYESIKNANNVIASVQQGVEGVSEDQLSRIEAEARFLRALAYYELVTKYGDVPLILEVKREPGGEEPRVPQADVYEQILTDLEFAQNNLPRKSQVSDPGRATRGAAYALEGETQLFLGSLEDVSVDGSPWEDARAAFQQVIDLGEYRLVDNYFDNFAPNTENNAESVFEIQYLQSSATGTNGRRAYEYGMLAWRNTTVHPHVTTEFEDGDPRRGYTAYEVCDEFFNGQLVKTTTRYEDQLGGCDLEPGQETRTTQNYNPDWAKYEYYERGGPSRWGNTDDGINIRVIRYAEVLVGLAEAQIELGNRTSPGGGSPSAQALLNRVRDRETVDVPPYPANGYNLNSYANAIETLYHTYTAEFSGEQVFYPAALRSWEHPDRPNYLERRTQPIQHWPDSPGFDPDRGMTPDQSDRIRRYWPIPQSEIESNPGISAGDQNPGY